jgi:hypothetical protein
MNGLDLMILGLNMMLNFAQLCLPDPPKAADLIYLMDLMAETEPVVDGFSLTQYVCAFEQLCPDFG